MDLKSGFLSAEEIFTDADNIGDVRKKEGKDRMIEFLAKSVHAVQNTSNDVMGTIADAFYVHFLPKSPVKDKEYYFEDHRLKPGMDVGDSIIGNVLGDDLSAVLEYADRIIMDYYEKTANARLRGYSEEEKSGLITSCIGEVDTHKGMNNS